ncbi:glycosyltransferase family 4 protein [Curtobacterium sp. MCBD17_032]|uniref:glycosyltransferase family 4 protein n=1 Tax=Curtobacterium sp. MCBD17_032 TaxID=2175659 RepID=UPI0015E8A13F|nr:glycosyltransferase family 4 protein [Curtobacterium sp. MCBD17_032]
MAERSTVDVIAISQLPPPVHGSTIMTRTFLESCDKLGLVTSLVDRRFSTSVGEIGETSLRKLFAAFSLFTRLWRALDRHRAASVVFFTTNRPPSFWMDVLLSLLLRAKRRDYIAYVHTSGYSELAAMGRLQARGVRAMLAGARSVVVLGESMKDDVRGFNDVIQVIPNTVGTVEPAGTQVHESPQLVYVSNLIPGKGAEDFMRIADRCLTEVPTARAVVIGGTSSPEYTNDLRAMLSPDSQARVRFAGPLFDAERDDVVAASSVLVFPSSYRFEAQPLTLLEGLRLAVPVVAYDVGGIKDIVADGVNGYLVTKNDWLASSDRCLAVLRSADLRRHLSAGARQTFDKRFSLVGYRRAWQSLLSGRAPE